MIEALPDDVLGHAPRQVRIDDPDHRHVGKPRQREDVVDAGAERKDHLKAGEAVERLLRRLPDEHVAHGGERFFRAAKDAVPVGRQDGAIGQPRAQALRPGLRIPSLGGDEKGRLHQSRTAAACATCSEKAAAISACV